MLSPTVALRAAVGQALDDVGLAASNDEQSVEKLLAALKEHGYVVVREVNGVFPGTKKE